MRMNLSQRFIFFFEKDSRQGLRRIRSWCPLFAKKSRLGFFLNAKSPQGGSDEVRKFDECFY